MRVILFRRHEVVTTQTAAVLCGYFPSQWVETRGYLHLRLKFCSWTSAHAHPRMYPRMCFQVQQALLSEEADWNYRGSFIRKMCLSGAHPPTEVEANRSFLRTRIANATPCSSDAPSSLCSGDTSLSLSSRCSNVDSQAEHHQPTMAPFKNRRGCVTVNRETLSLFFFFFFKPDRYEVTKGCYSQPKLNPERWK